jgi:hypothetical protein
LDINAIVLPVVVFNGLGDFIEPELLLSGVVSPSLEDKVSSSKHLNNSVEWKLRNNVEWSIDMESKFFVNTLSSCLVGLIKIDDIPFLGFRTIVTPYLNWVSFFISSSSNIEDLLVSPIDELTTFELEDLEPS